MEDIGITNEFLDEVLRLTSSTYLGMNKLSPKLHNVKKFSTVYNREGHFVCIIATRGKLLYFDPLGLPPFSKDIQNFMQSDNRVIIINEVTVQHPLSFFCAFFVMCKILSEERPNVKLKPFSSQDLQKNDSISVSNIQRLLECLMFIHF